MKPPDQFPTLAPLPGGGFLLPRPLTCGACGATWDNWPAGFDPARAEFGMLILCVFCGHVMSLQPPFVLRDLTAAEARWIEKHPSFPEIRKKQEYACRRMIG